jgi:hypothetical protein
VNYFVGIYLLQHGDFGSAGDMLGQYTTALTGDSALGGRVREDIRNPASRDAALQAMADTATRPEQAAAIYRLRGDDDAAIAAFERVVAGADFEGIYLPHVVAVLGPELVARPRTQAAIERFFERLRERYGR